MKKNEVCFVGWLDQNKRENVFWAFGLMHESAILSLPSLSTSVGLSTNSERKGKRTQKIKYTHNERRRYKSLTNNHRHRCG